LRVRRYLEYVLDYKKQIKIEENEVMEILNENLRDQMTVYLNGRILKTIAVFGNNFGLDFLSEITFIFINQTFTVDENIMVVQSIN
jgi:hypothetical protein